jgi:sodium/proline symporter
VNVYEKLSHPAALAMFLATLFLPVVVGLLVMRRMRSQSDFYVGGRTMGKIVVALSAVSSGRSSWLVLGLSGMAYTMGAGALWAFVGYSVVELFQFLYVGRRLRAETERHDSLTLLDYLESRHGDARHVIRTVGAVIVLVFITAYVAAQLYAGAKTLSTALDLGFAACLFASCALILVYMMLGGYIAVAYNDVVRAVILLVGLIVLPAVALAKAGGAGTVRAALGALDPGLIDPLSLGAGVIIGFLGIGLGSPGQPHILVRYMSIDDPRNLRWAAWLGTFWNVALGAGAVIVGLLGRAMVPEAAALPDADPEMVYLMLSADSFGPAMYGLLVGGVFAAILSTADSQLLVVASTFKRDLWEGVLKRATDLDERQGLRLNRVVVLLSGILALLLAFVAQDLVFWLVLFAWGGLGASLGPAIIASLYWERTSRDAVVAGMLTGTVVTIVWRLWLKTPTGIYELIPAFALSAAAIALVSAVRPAPERAAGSLRSTRLRP